jgi:hypothetical protein
MLSFHLRLDLPSWLFHISFGKSQLCFLNIVNIRDNLHSLVCPTVLFPSNMRNVSAIILRPRSSVRLCDFVAILHEMPEEDGLTQWPKHVAGGTRLK